MTTQLNRHRLQQDAGVRFPFTTSSLDCDGSTTSRRCDGDVTMKLMDEWFCFDSNGYGWRKITTTRTASGAAEGGDEAT